MASFIRKYFILFLLFCYINPLSANNDIRKGLCFYSYEVDKDKRTCLDLTPDKPLDFSDGFSMEFEFKLKPKIEPFGYVFRILSNDSLNIDLLSDVYVGNFSLIIGKNTSLQFTKKEIPDYKPNEWIKVRLAYDPVKKNITLGFNGKDKAVGYAITDISTYDIFFGGNTHKKFSTTDVPPMIIKNIRLYDNEQKLVRNWELARHNKDCVYDECKNDKATVSNPLWEIDSHAQWEKAKTIVMPGMYQQIAFDELQERIFVVKDNHIIVYHIKSGQTDTIKVLKGIPYNLMSNQLVYDTKNDQLISYDFNSKHLARFDFQKKEWNNNNTTKAEPSFWHHGKYYRPEDSTLITMGGYGFHQYSGLLHKYKEKDNEWEKFDLSRIIEPRYLGSFGNWKDSVFLYFGGYGNESGVQRESPHNYYDLYSIDTKDFKARKIWELENIKSHFTNGNSLIVNDSKRSFYTLSYPNKRYETHIALHEYKIDTPEFQILGDSIPYFFNDVESFCDLFKPSDQSKLITVTVTAKNNNSEINIYTIAYPPLSLSDINQIEKGQGIKGTKWLITMLGGILIVLFAVFGFFSIRKTYKNRAFKNIYKNLPESDPIVPRENILQETKVPSICLLGDFVVTDRDRNNISNNFTPTTKQVFLLLLLGKLKNKHGISSSELRNLLWYDKDDDSARNNRNVYINRLRVLLKNLGDIQIINNKGYWSISSTDNSVFCDYETVLDLISVINEKPDLDKTLLNELLGIAIKGKLLPFYEAEWLDDFKTHYSNSVIEFLLKTANQPELKNELALLLKMAEVILLHDDLEENGIRLKCNALFRLGKKKQALESFNKFAEDHLKLLAIETKLSFEEIVKN